MSFLIGQKSNSLQRLCEKTLWETFWDTRCYSSSLQLSSCQPKRLQSGRDKHHMGSIFWLDFSNMWRSNPTVKVNKSKGDPMWCSQNRFFVWKKIAPLSFWLHQKWIKKSWSDFFRVRFQGKATRKVVFTSFDFVCRVIQCDTIEKVF